MPRVAHPPRGANFPAWTPQKSPFNTTLNDDRQEKAARLQSRHALHDLQMNTLKAAASPVRRQGLYEHTTDNGQYTPKRQLSKGKENIEDGGLAIIAAPTATPAKRVPILANFEEWMKMATDNKINAANSWNFALIDYFHDMSLLREGDSVNFQKASCTLDGCVKIYTSRVDSVATETGKLLSGLADGSSRKGKQGDDADEDEHQGDEDEEDASKKKSKKRSQRSSEATLATSFAALQLKKMDLEFSVDPLFKKAAADFDEGGAKGLLLNHLSIDPTGRIIFDSSDDVDGAGDKRSHEATSKNDVQEDRVGERRDGETPMTSHANSMQTLRSKFFPDLDALENQYVCPSLRAFDIGSDAGGLNLALPKISEDGPTSSGFHPGFGEETGIVLEGDDVAGFEDDDLLGGFGNDAEFGHGGEAWARNAALDPDLHIANVGGGDAGGDVAMETNSTEAFDPQRGSFLPELHFKSTGQAQDDLLAHFDRALSSNWAGPQNWKIRKIKEKASLNQAPKQRRREKEPFSVDFLAPLDRATLDMIHTQAPTNATISLPKAQWRSKNRHLLPDDKHFSSKQLLQLFLKPKARIRSRRQGFGTTKRTSAGEIPQGISDEAFWAQRQRPDDTTPLGDAPVGGDYDAIFFQDDGSPPAAGFDDDEFVDAGENPMPQQLGGLDSQGVGMQGTGDMPGAFGSQLVTQNRRTRPDYVQYARVAKKVDVRKLKEEMWKGIGFEMPEQTTPAVKTPDQENEPLKFTAVMNNLQHAYPREAMADISTSYCFICLLHLANEKGLSIDNEVGLEELRIQMDRANGAMEIEAAP